MFIIFYDHNYSFAIKLLTEVDRYEYIAVWWIEFHMDMSVSQVVLLLEYFSSENVYDYDLS